MSQSPNDVIYQSAADRLVKELGLKHRLKLSNRRAARVFWAAVCLMVVVTNGSSTVGGIFAFLLMFAIFGVPVTSELTKESQAKFNAWLASQSIKNGE